jgi:succinoglycan biosynthesis protein ExoU
MNMKTPMPSVCVIIAAYRASATIRRAVRSALTQSPVSEVIVVDDASPDETSAAARAADDGSGRLRVLRQAINGGPSRARNRAIQESTAPWLAILDADDFFLPGRIAQLLMHADGADFIADDLWQVPHNDPDGPRISLLGEAAPTTPRTVDLAEFVASNVSRRGRLRGEMGFLKPLMNRDFLNRHGLLYRDGMHLGEDYELYARALGLGARFLLLPAHGYISVIRPDSLSARHSASDLQQLRDCDGEIAQAFTLTAAEAQALRRHYLSVDCRLQWQRLIDAVKARDGLSALKTFLRPLPVPLYLLEKLAGQVVVRSVRTAGRLRPSKWPLARG